MSLTYLYFGLTVEDPIPAIGSGLFILLWCVSAGIPLALGKRPAAIIVWSSRMGLILAWLLPVISVLVLLIWERAADRPDLGMGGLMLYNMPIVAFGIAIVFTVFFWLLGQAARKRLAIRPEHMEP